MNQIVFHPKMSNICWFHLLKYDDLLLLFVIYDSKRREFGVWTEALSLFFIHFECLKGYLINCENILHINR